MATDTYARDLITKLTGKVDAQAATIASQASKIVAQQAAIAEIQAEVDAIANAPDTPDIPPDTPPEPDIPPPLPVNGVIKVPVGGNLQAAFDQAKLSLANGSVEIRIAVGTYTGNFVIRAAPNAKAGAQLTIRADVSDGTLAPNGKPWIDRSHEPAMVKLVSPNTAWALTSEDAIHDVKFFGVCTPPNKFNPGADLAYIGRGDMTDLSQMPYNIEFDSCLFYADPVNGQHRGLQLNVRNGIVRRSYFDDFLERGRDCQAFAMFAGPGPLLIEDTFMEASHENMIIGGADPKIAGLIPSDITVRRCHFYKDPNWKTRFPQGSYVVKNLFELKSARRVLIDACVFENNWPDGQSGDAIVLTIRNQDGAAPWSEISDVEIRNSVVLNVDGFAFQLLGKDYRMTSARGKNMTIHDVLTVNVKGGITSNDGYQPTSIRHVTFADVKDKFLQFSGAAMPSGSFIFESNVTGSGLYAIAGEGTTVGKPSLDTYAPGALFNKNVIEQPAGWGMAIPNNTLIPNGTLAAKFDTRKRYTGSELGADGKKVGADVDAIIAAVPWAKW